MNTHTHTHTHTHAHTHIRAHTHTHAHTSHAHTFCTFSLSLTHTHKHTHALTHTHVHARAHTHTSHARTHTRHTHTPSARGLLWGPSQGPQGRGSAGAEGTNGRCECVSKKAPGTFECCGVTQRGCSHAAVRTPPHVHVRCKRTHKHTRHYPPPHHLRRVVPHEHPSSPAVCSHSCC